VFYSHRRLSTRSLTTVLWNRATVRMGYSLPSAPSIFPLNQALALPARSFSYELQRRLFKAAAQNPFLESVQTIAELTGVAVSKRSLEEILPDAARDFDAFYQQRSVATAAGSILVAAVDGKGIPMVKPCGAQPSAANQRAEGLIRNEWPLWLPSSRARLGCEPHNKLSKAFSPPPARHRARRLLPHVRRTNEYGPVCSRARPPLSRRWLKRMDRRDPSRSATRLALTDGERALQIRVHQKLNVTLILDLMARAGETLEGRQCSSMPKEAWKPTFGS